MDPIKDIPPPVSTSRGQALQQSAIYSVCVSENTINREKLGGYFGLLSSSASNNLQGLNKNLRVDKTKSSENRSSGFGMRLGPFMWRVASKPKLKECS